VRVGGRGDDDGVEVLGEGLVEVDDTSGSVQGGHVVGTPRVDVVDEDQLDVGVRGEVLRVHRAHEAGADQADPCHGHGTSSAVGRLTQPPSLSWLAATASTNWTPTSPSAPVGKDSSRTVVAAPSRRTTSSSATSP
jgi:hypothetical protein